MVKGWVHEWELRFDIGFSPSETKKWIDYFQAESINTSGLVNSDDVEAHNNRMLSTQFGIPLVEDFSMEDAWSSKRRFDSRLHPQRCGGESARRHLALRDGRCSFAGGEKESRRQSVRGRGAAPSQGGA